MNVDEQLPRRICAIVNPRAGSWKRYVSASVPITDLVQLWLCPSDPDHVGVKLMQKAKDGVNLTEDALAEGYDTIVAVGGDGTVNDVIQALCGREGPARARLGLIPMGTANVLARDLGLPLRDPAAAGAVVTRGEVRQLDLGRAGGQWFALVAGIGFDGAVTRAVNPRWKRRIGKLAYVFSAARTAFRFAPARITLTLDRGVPQQFNAYLVVIANGGRYAGRYRLARDVRPDDGMLDLFVCLRRGSLLASLARNGLALARNRLHLAPGVMRLRAHHVAVDADRPLPVQLDGDTVGVTPTVIEVIPGVLEMLAPPMPQINLSRSRAFPAS